MKVTVKLDNIQNILKRRGLERGGKAQQAAAVKALDLCSEYVPMNTGRLVKSGRVTKEGVVWAASYAKEAYYGKTGGAGNMANGRRGPYWAARMKADRMDDIKQAAAKAAGGKKV